MTAETSPRFSQRLQPEFFDLVQSRVVESVVAEGLDAVLTDHPEDVAYLTGFFHHPCERPVAVWLGADGSSVLLTPALERENAERQRARAASHASYAEFPGIEPPFAPLARIVATGGGRGMRIGVTSYMTMERLAAVRRVLPEAELVPTELVTIARYVKFDVEIALHREAARITDVMLEAGVAHVREAIAAGGVLPSESELTRVVTSTGTSLMDAEHDDVVVVSMLAGGLVYSGANSAFPHGLPSSYRLQPGETFMLSLGCAVGGRFVEGERTFILGEPSDDQRRYYEAVRAAQESGITAIRPGQECRQANETCIDVIRDAGLGQYLRHRQGHGIGLGMHEPPWLESGDATLLKAGMIVSNEPGIYIPGHAGYRISDSMLVTAQGSEPLTAFPKSLDDCVIAL